MHTFVNVNLIEHLDLIKDEIAKQEIELKNKQIYLKTLQQSIKDKKEKIHLLRSKLLA